MHRIAAALDTGAASLFVYVRDTEDLHAQILDALLGSVAASLPVGGNRSERLAAALTRYMRTLFNWPTGPNYLAFVDLLLALLVEGAFPTGTQRGRSICSCNLRLLWQQSRAHGRYPHAPLMNFPL